VTTRPTGHTGDPNLPNPFDSNGFDAYTSMTNEASPQPRNVSTASVHPPNGASAATAPVGRDRRRRWPLLLIGASAGTATWTGWVGLGALTGFGVVHPLPGIWDSLTVNTAITLPVGVEAYAVYALSIATDTRPITRLARRWAWTSAAGALLLGMGGQIAYHLLDSRGITTAPWWVVALVSCLPVLVLGAASLLWHLAGIDPADAGSAVSQLAISQPEVPGPVEDDRGAGVPEPPAVARGTGNGADETAPVRPPGRRPSSVTVPVFPADRGSTPRTVGRSTRGRSRHTSTATPGGTAADAEIAARLAATGTVPPVREIKATHRVGGTRAVRIRAIALDAVAASEADSTPSDPTAGREARAPVAAPDGATGPRPAESPNASTSTGNSADRPDGQQPHDEHVHRPETTSQERHHKHEK
jgi:hypothetical protein